VDLIIRVTSPDRYGGRAWHNPPLERIPMHRDILNLRSSVAAAAAQRPYVMQHAEDSTPATPTLDYARPRRTDATTAVTAFWAIFWVLGVALVVAAVFARMLIRQTDAQLLQISAMIWSAAAVLFCTKHRLRFGVATAWVLSLWLPLLYWLVKEFAALGLSSLFFWPVTVQVAIFAALTASLAISLRFGLWRGR